ncbi:DUF2000 domain-containing protein [Candidatus Peregrinibacteria bacterium]|nr:DUF2000 domain-containing protein [Candidatus Peregrinibacteria bacterium]
MSGGKGETCLPAKRGMPCDLHIPIVRGATEAQIEIVVYLEYRDKDGGIHPNISHFPFIVLKADNANQIRTVRSEALSQRIPFTDFTSTMTVGTSTQQQENTRKSAESDLEYYGICLFGETNVLREITRKFSLFA